ncbi:unnamed protein product, partial [Musa hybrid cultivar]
KSGRGGNVATSTDPVITAPTPHCYHPPVLALSGEKPPLCTTRGCQPPPPSSSSFLYASPP